MRLRFGDPERLRVVVQRQSADGVQRRPVPHVLRVESRPDALHGLASVVRIQTRGKSEPGIDLPAARRIDVRVVIAAHVHPQLVCPHAHWAMYFWDMMWVSVSLSAVGTMLVSARKAAFSGAVICVGVWLLSAFRALTKSMWEEMPFRYAASAVTLSPMRYAASAFTNCSWAYVIAGIFALSSNRYRPGCWSPPVPR